MRDYFVSRKERTVISIGIGNYYGDVEIYQGEDGIYYIGIGNWTGWDAIPISREFYEACRKEFHAED